MTFDYVIVGGGAAGCILANRLTQDPERSVLLLEAGPDFAAVDNCPPAVLDERNIPLEFLWNYAGFMTEASTEPIVVVRGKVMGGSTSVNTMIYQRGAPEDYDSWGSTLWTNEALQPYFKLIERDLDVDDSSRGTEGQIPLQRFSQSEWAPTQRAFFQAAIDLGFAEVADNLLALDDGVWPIARNSQDGIRMSTAMTYLNPIRSRPNLTVEGDTDVQRVLIKNGRAIGVETLCDGESGERRGEQIILSAGAIGSPQILTLSGIGPVEALGRIGIPVVLNLPGVGRNLTDHPVIQVIAKLQEGVEEGDARNMTALSYTSTNSSTRTDMFIGLASGDFSSGVISRTPDGPIDVSFFCCLNLADSVGEIEVISADVRDLPQIHYHYLESEHDRERLREAVRLATQMLESNDFAKLVKVRTSPTDQQLASDAALDAWMPSALMTALHGTGTCKMGPADDAAAVVDFDGTVHGIEGLRVVDLSIAPTVVRTPTNATAMVIAERISQMILDENTPG